MTLMSELEEALTFIIEESLTFHERPRMISVWSKNHEVVVEEAVVGVVPSEANKRRS